MIHPGRIQDIKGVLISFFSKIVAVIIHSIDDVYPAFSQNLYKFGLSDQAIQDILRFQVFPFSQYDFEICECIIVVFEIISYKTERPGVSFFVDDARQACCRGTGLGCIPDRQVADKGQDHFLSLGLIVFAVVANVSGSGFSSTQIFMRKSTFGFILYYKRIVFCPLT